MNKIIKAKVDKVQAILDKIAQELSKDEFIEFCEEVESIAEAMKDARQGDPDDT